MGKVAEAPIGFTMLTRLQVKGFKNLADVDVSFGPFTCVAGTNGVGKSNLFDAITFLAATADLSLIEADRRVRDEQSRSNRIQSLFFRAGDEIVDEIFLVADMLIPSEGLDELGQPAHASCTFLRYTLVLGHETTPGIQHSERLIVKREELTYIKKQGASKELLFAHSDDWLDSVVTGQRKSPFISTVEDAGVVTIRLHQDGNQGRPRNLLAANLPRTVLSSANAVESPTALLAKQEMQSWRLLQLEPSALRNSDAFNAPTHIGADGSNMAATLYHLARSSSNPNDDEAAVYVRVANRVSQLVQDIRSIGVDVDERRELLTLQVTTRDSTLHPARALSDGTLRFLALAILEEDSSAQGLLCLEEPENGIHPERIPVHPVHPV